MVAKAKGFGISFGSTLDCFGYALGNSMMAVLTTRAGRNMRAQPVSTSHQNIYQTREEGSTVAGTRQDVERG